MSQKEISIKYINEYYGLEVDEDIYWEFFDKAYLHAEENSNLDNHETIKALIDYACYLAKTDGNLNNVMKNSMKDFHEFVKKFFREVSGLDPDRLIE